MIGGKMGNVGWGWTTCVPYFERSERRVDAAGHAGRDGPLDVKDVTPFLHPMRQNWLDAAAELDCRSRTISTGRIRKDWGAIR